MLSCFSGRIYVSDRFMFEACKRDNITVDIIMHHTLYVLKSITSESMLVFTVIVSESRGNNIRR